MRGLIDNFFIKLYSFCIIFLLSLDIPQVHVQIREDRKLLDYIFPCFFELIQRFLKISCLEAETCKFIVFEALENLRLVCSLFLQDNIRIIFPLRSHDLHENTMSLLSFCLLFWIRLNNFHFFSLLNQFWR